MPSSRTWNRREFNIAQNGYFTILKSAGWFSTVPLPEGFRYFGRKSKSAASPQAPGQPANINAAVPAFVPTIRLQTIDSGASGHHLMRLALIVLAATALAWIGLWCTAHP